MSAIMQMLASMTKEQNKQIFENTNKKTEEKGSAPVKKFNLKLKLRKKKSDTYIVTSTDAAIPATTVVIQALKK